MAAIEGSPEEIPKPKPLRAVMPLQAMHRTSPIRLRNRISPDIEISPGLDLCPATSEKSGVAWVTGYSSSSCSRGTKTNLMRRTASLDAIHLKGPKETAQFSLLVDKFTQTPGDWIPCCLAEVTNGALVSQPGENLPTTNNTTNNNSRRTSGPAPGSPWSQHAPVSPSTGENIEKLIRQRLQRTNKEGPGVSGSRCSPIHADHSVLAPIPVLAKPYACVQANVPLTTSIDNRSASIPQLPRPLLPRLRSSVEELNQEIESLVLRPSDEEHEQWNSSRQDGRRAPCPDYYRMRRSVNTQTPARCSSTNSSTRTTPSISPTLLSPLHGTVTPPDSPGAPRLPTSFVSPHINKFYREPPDGCERVALKPTDESSAAANAWSPVKPPPTVFTLLPSLGSAFCAPGRTSGSGSAFCDPGKSSRGSGRGSSTPEEVQTDIQ